MQSTRFYPNYGYQTQVLEPDNGTRKRRMAEREEEAGQKLTKAEPLYVMEEVSEEELPEISRKQMRDEEEPDLNTRRLKRGQSAAVYDGTQVAITELVELTREKLHITSLIIPSSSRVSDLGVVRTLMGRDSLQELNILDCENISDQTLYALGRHCPRVSKVTLAKCSGLTDEGIEVLASKCRDLREVHLDFSNALTDQSLISLGRHSKRLEECTFSENRHITLAGLQALLGGCSELKRLELWHCHQVTDSWIETIIEFAPNLEKLDISGCKNISIEAKDRLFYRFGPKFALITKS